MTDETPNSEIAPPSPVKQDTGTSTPPRGFSLATLMFVVTLVSMICGLSVVAPDWALLPPLFRCRRWRTAIILRHQANQTATATIAARLAEFVGSCIAVMIVAIAAASCGFAACLVGAFGGLALGSLWGDPNGGILVIGLPFGLISGGLVAAFVAYLILLHANFFPIPKQDVSRREKLALIVALIAAAAIAIISGLPFNL